MQPVQLQKDKLALIEWITQLGDEAVLQQLKEIMLQENSYGFTLSEEQKLVLEEGTEKYLSGDEKPHSWEDIKSSAAQLKKLINEKKA